MNQQYSFRKCMDALVFGCGLSLALSFSMTSYVSASETFSLSAPEEDGDEPPFIVTNGERVSSAPRDEDAFLATLPKRDAAWTFRRARNLIRDSDYRDVPLVVGTRKEWGARPITEAYDPIEKIKGIVIHQSETPENASVRGIQEYHQRVKKWADIGYHFVIAQDKYHQWKIFEGRPLSAKGAHVGRRGDEDLNIGQIGICLLGDFDQPNNPERLSDYPPAERARRLKMPLKPANLLQADPKAIYLLGQLVDHLMTTYSSGVKEITGHGAGDHAAFPGHKSCPGQGTYHIVEALRSRYGLDNVDRTFR